MNFAPLSKQMPERFSTKSPEDIFRSSSHHLTYHNPAVISLSWSLTTDFLQLGVEKTLNYMSFRDKALFYETQQVYNRISLKDCVNTEKSSSIDRLPFRHLLWKWCKIHPKKCCRVSAKRSANHQSCMGHLWGETPRDSKSVFGYLAFILTTV